MAKLLSPGIGITEVNKGFTTPNLPSSNCFSVLRADYGPAFELTGVSSEDGLVANFGKPTKNNYNDWFNTKNFYDYASSMNVVRPIDSARITENVSLTLSGGNSGTVNTTDETAMDIVQGSSQANIFNQTLAEVTLPSLLTDSISVNLAEIRIPTANLTNATEIATFDSLAIVNGTQATGAVAAASVIPITAGGAGAGDFTLQYDAGNEAALWVGGTPTGWSTTLSFVFAVDGADTVFTVTGTVSAAKLTFYNRYVTSNQDIAVGVASDAVAWTKNVSTDIANKFSSYFDAEPVWANNEVAILVFVVGADGSFTQVESYIGSYLSTGRDIYNKSSFIEDILLNANSRIFVKVGTNGVVVNTCGGTIPKLHHTHYNTVYPRTANTFPGTTYSGSYAVGDITDSFDIINDPDTSDIGLILGHQLSMGYAAQIAALRKDAFAINAPFDYSKLVGQTSDVATAYLTKNMGFADWDSSSTDVDFLPSAGKNTYAGTFGNMKYQYDKYNDMNRWLPVHGDVAGLMAQTDRELNPWWPGAGLQRGQMKNVIKLALKPNKTNRDSLYVNSINVIYVVPGEGQAVVWGQKTATSVASIFSRINVRRLMITIEKTIGKAMLPFVMEFADQTTWDQIAGVINPYLASVQAARGLEAFKVIVDSTNNTPSVINQNKIVVDVHVKPTQVAEFIELTFSVTKSGVQFG